MRRLPGGTGRALALAVAVAAVTLVMASGTLHETVLATFEWAEARIVAYPAAGAVLFVLLSALSAMLAFVSSAVLVPVALVVWGGSTTALLLWAGWILGGVAAWTVARFLGRPVVIRLASREALARYEEWVSPGTPFGVVLLFQLALPSEIPGYVLGLARYPLRRYLLILGIVELPFAIGLVFLGAGFLERRILLLVAVGAAGILLALGALHLLHHRLASARRPPTS